MLVTCKAALLKTVMGVNTKKKHVANKKPTRYNSNKLTIQVAFLILTLLIRKFIRHYTKLKGSETNLKDKLNIQQRGSA